MKSGLPTPYFPHLTLRDNQNCTRATPGTLSYYKYNSKKLTHTWFNQYFSDRQYFPRSRFLLISCFSNRDWKSSAFNRSNLPYMEHKQFPFNLTLIRYKNNNHPSIQTYLSIEHTQYPNSPPLHQHTLSVYLPDSWQIASSDPRFEIATA